MGAINPSGVYNPIVSGIGQFDVVYTFTSIATGCTNSDSLEITTIPRHLHMQGLTQRYDNAPTLLLEGFTPTTGINWFGLTSEGNGGIINPQIGTINPLQLSPGAHEYIIEYGESTCYHTDTLTVNISPLPTIAVNSEDLFCSNDEKQYLRITLH